MIFMLVVGIVTTLTVPLFGGRLGNLARLRLRASWTVALSLGIQLVITEVLNDRGGATVHAVAHIVSFGIAAIFLVANRHLFGIWVVALGAALNALVIVANGGVMPATAEAVRRSGFDDPGSGYANSRALEDPRLLPLGDIFALPSGIPFANVFSIGDIILLAHPGAVARRATATTRPWTPAGTRR
jgi:hypothetical protein